MPTNSPNASAGGVSPKGSDPVRVSTNKGQLSQTSHPSVIGDTPSPPSVPTDQEPLECTSPKGISNPAEVPVHPVLPHVAEHSSVLATTGVTKPTVVTSRAEPHKPSDQSLQMSRPSTSNRRASGEDSSLAHVCHASSTSSLSTPVVKVEGQRTPSPDPSSSADGQRSQLASSVPTTSPNDQSKVVFPVPGANQPRDLDTNVTPNDGENDCGGSRNAGSASSSSKHTTSPSESSLRVGEIVHDTPRASQSPHDPLARTRSPPADLSKHIDVFEEPALSRVLQMNPNLASSQIPLLPVGTLPMPPFDNFSADFNSSAQLPPLPPNASSYLPPGLLVPIPESSLRYRMVVALCLSKSFVLPRRMY